MSTPTEAIHASSTLDATQHDQGIPAAGRAGACAQPCPGGCRRRKDHRLRAGQPARPQLCAERRPVRGREWQRRQRAMHVLATRAAGQSLLRRDRRGVPDPAGGRLRARHHRLAVIGASWRERRGRPGRRVVRRHGALRDDELGWRPGHPRNARRVVGNVRIGSARHAGRHLPGRHRRLAARGRPQPGRRQHRLQSVRHRGIARTPRGGGRGCERPDRSARQRPHPHPGRPALPAERARRSLARASRCRPP